jgi:hypothetical protein
LGGGGAGTGPPPPPAARATGICDTGRTTGWAASEESAAVGPIDAASTAAIRSEPRKRNGAIVPS